MGYQDRVIGEDISHVNSEPTSRELERNIYVHSSARHSQPGLVSPIIIPLSPHHLSISANN